MTYLLHYYILSIAMTFDFHLYSQFSNNSTHESLAV